MIKTFENENEREQQVFYYVQNNKLYGLDEGDRRRMQSMLSK